MLRLTLLLLLLAAPAYAEESEDPVTDTSTDADPGPDADAATDPVAGADTAAATATATAADPDTDAPTVTLTVGDTAAAAAQAATKPDPKPAPTAPTEPPKVAYVVAGDPDETLRNTAAFVETETIAAGLTAPSDPALRAAMRGEPPREEDGLETLRAMRRGLGLDPRKDQASYQRIGLIAGADALVVIRRQGLILIEVFDVAAAQFYEGVLEFDTSETEERVRFIESRAEQAQLRWSQPTPAPAAETKKGPEVNEPEEPADESRAKKRWKKAWPYVVVGALLAGGVTYLIIDRRSDPQSGVPLLRFRPGEE